MGPEIIKVQNLVKTFRVSQRANAGFFAAVRSLFNRQYTDVHALKSVSLNIRQGEIRGLIGPNGAGKSTMIKVLSGVLFPTDGLVEVMGYNPWLQREEYVRNLGVVFGQKTQLWWDLPAIDTLHLNKVLYDIPENTFNENLDYFVRVLNIADIIKKPVRQLSLGERMKCEFVCAMMHSPKIVFLDEPTIGLDLVAKDSIRAFIKKVNRDRNTTVILTTQDLSDIENLCENITIINNGCIIYNDTLDKLRTFFEAVKIIEVKFVARPGKDLLTGYDIIAKDELSVKIKVDLTRTNLQDEIAGILGKFKVHDVNIHNIEIEDIIKRLYAH